MFDWKEMMTLEEAYPPLRVTWKWLSVKAVESSRFCTFGLANMSVSQSVSSLLISGTFVLVLHMHTHIWHWAWSNQINKPINKQTNNQTHKPKSYLACIKVSTPGSRLWFLIFFYLNTRKFEGEKCLLCSICFDRKNTTTP